MGLLDMFGTSAEDPRTAAMLQLASGLLGSSKGAGMQGLLAGVQGYTGTMAQAKELERKRALDAQDRAMRQQLQEAQMQEYRAQAMQRMAAVQADERKAAEQQRIGGLLQTAVSPVRGIEANTASGVAGPRPEALAAVGQRPPINFQQLLAQGVPPQMVEALAKAADYGRPEVARVEETMINGRPVKRQFDRFGSAVGEALPQWKAPIQADTGGNVSFLDPVSLSPLQQLRKSNTPDALLGAATTRRGQDMSDARSREKNAIDQAAAGKVEWKQGVNGEWVGLPKEVTGQGPVTPVSVAAPSKRESQAKSALDILDVAEPLLKKSTGSYIGAGIDLAGRAVGYGTEGAQVTGQLKALEGALMMAQPRMEGPQSNLDVGLYRQMAAQIGDPTVPNSVKQAAAREIRKLHQKYVGSSGGATGSWDDNGPSGFKVLGKE